MNPSTKPQSPMCPYCGHNKDVVELKVKYRPRLKYLKIPLPYTDTVMLWWCQRHGGAYLD